jgi:hypothetical protein
LTGELVKCDGFFNRDKILKEIKPNLWWTILVGLIIAIAFTITLNSYWFILLNIYKNIKDVVDSERGRCYRMVETTATFDSVNFPNLSEEDKVKDIGTRVTPFNISIQDKKTFKDMVLINSFVYCLFYLYFNYFINNNSINNHLCSKS